MKKFNYFMALACLLVSTSAWAQTVTEVQKQQVLELIHSHKMMPGFMKHAQAVAQNHKLAKKAGKMPYGATLVDWNDSTHTWTDTVYTDMYTWNSNGEPVKVESYSEYQGVKYKDVYSSFVQQSSNIYGSSLLIEGYDNWMPRATTYYQWKSNAWTMTGKDTIGLDGQGRLIDLKHTSASPSTNDPNLHITGAYDSHDNISDVNIYTTVAGIDVQVSGTRFRPAYNGSGKITSLPVLTYNLTAQGWDTVMIENYLYDAAGMINDNTIQMNSGAGWMDTVDRSDITWATFDNHINMESALGFDPDYYLSDNSAPALVGGDKYKTYTVSSYDAADHIWMNDNRYTKTYTSSNMLASEQTEYYFAGSWENGDKTVYEYDTDGHMTKQTYYVNDGNGGWEANDVTGYDRKYDTDNDISRIIQWDDQGSGKMNKEMTIYMYQGFVGINAPKAAQGFSLYPQPATQVVNVVMPEGSRLNGYVRVMSMDGKVVMENKAEANSNRLSMDVSGLPSGLYFVNIFDGQNMLSQKLIKQ